MRRRWNDLSVRVRQRVENRLKSLSGEVAPQRADYQIQRVSESALPKAPTPFIAAEEP